MNMIQETKEFIQDDIVMNENQETKDESVLLSLIHDNLQNETNRLANIDRDMTTVAKAVVNFSKAALDTKENVATISQDIQNLLSDTTQSNEVIQQLLTATNANTDNQTEVLDLLGALNVKAQNLADDVNEVNRNTQEKVDTWYNDFKNYLTNSVDRLDEVANQLSQVDIQAPIQVLSDKIEQNQQVVDEQIESHQLTHKTITSHLESLNDQLSTLIDDLHETYRRTSERQDLSGIKKYLEAIDVQLNVLNQKDEPLDTNILN